MGIRKGSIEEFKLKKNIQLCWTPRGLSRAGAATYIGISVSKFDNMVAERRFPAARRIDGRLVWDRIELDAAFDDLPVEGGVNDWDEVM